MKTTLDSSQPALDDAVRRRLTALLSDPSASASEVPDYGSSPSEPVPRRAVILADDSASATRVLRRGAAADEGPLLTVVDHTSGGYEPEAEEESKPRQAIRWVWEFTRAHTAAVGVVLLAVCLWAGYSASQARSTQLGETVAITTPGATGSSGVPSPGPSGPSASASASPSPAAVIEVHVLGGVNRPGVVRVPQGSRLGDVLKAAGGLATDGDPGELNLAALAEDGSQVIVGTTAKPRGEVRPGGSGGGPGTGGGTSGGSGASDGKVSLNSATAAQLETLPGVGPVTAQKIIAWREEHGRFSKLEELQEVPGIGAKTYQQLAPHIRL